MNLAERCLPSNLHLMIRRSSFSLNFLLFPPILLSFNPSGPSIKNLFLSRSTLRLVIPNLFAASFTPIFLPISSKITFFLIHTFALSSCGLSPFSISETTFYDILKVANIRHLKFGVTKPSYIDIVIYL